MSDEMNDFEKQMAKALQRLEAPENFAQRVMQRAEAGSFAACAQARKGWSLPASWRWMMSPWAGGALAALLVAGVFVTGARMHQEHAKQAQATQQFEQATQITDRALEHAREKMRKAGVDLDTEK